MARQLVFSSADAAMVTFAVSCQWETLASLRVLAVDPRHVVHGRWAAAARDAVDDRIAILRDLVGSAATRDYLPDFLTPTPSTLTPDLHAELDQVVRTPPDVVRAELSHLRSRWTPRLQRLYERPELLAGVVDQFARYWDVALAPYWPRIRRALHGEIERRVHRAATDGVGWVLNALHERVRWDGAQMHVAGTTCAGAGTLDGAGIRLVPSVFVWPDVLVVADRRPGQLCFPIRGTAAVWDGRREPPRSLNAVLGRTKARLLATLDGPMSSAELATELRLRPASVSEHLAALRAAGLVTSHRNGRRLVSFRTELGSRLVGP